jgi:hypothetical protein
MTTTEGSDVPRNTVEAQSPASPDRVDPEWVGADPCTWGVVVSYRRDRLRWLGVGPGTVVPASGLVALTFGVLFSLAVGIGLMALVFYSSRHDYDEPPKFVQDPDHTDREA